MEWSNCLAKLNEDLRLRSYSSHTMRTYEREVRNFLEFTGKPEDEINEQDVRTYILYLMECPLEKKTINTYQGAIRFFYAVTLNKYLNYSQAPRLKENKKLPEIFTREEAALVITLCESMVYKAMFSLAYGSGLRVSEICALRVQDIDSKQMRVFVNCGKMSKDRYTILSENTLVILRNYWRLYRPKSPEGYLFPGLRNNAKRSPEAVNDALKRCCKAAGIRKNLSMHSFRHSFATHLLEDGTDIFTIKTLLGHSSISSTTVYLRLAKTPSVESPLDRVVEDEC